MSPNCKCGGKFISTDIFHPCGTSPDTGHTLYSTVRIKPGYASWECNKCGKPQVQKLRVSKRIYPHPDLIAAVKAVDKKAANWLKKGFSKEEADYIELTNQNTTLDCAFVWEDTPQGNAYWHKIYELIYGYPLI